jgi:hypothetical protein
MRIDTKSAGTFSKTDLDDVLIDLAVYGCGCGCVAGFWFFVFLIFSVVFRAVLK